MSVCGKGPHEKIPVVKSVVLAALLFILCTGGCAHGPSPASPSVSPVAAPHVSPLPSPSRTSSPEATPVGVTDQLQLSPAPSALVVATGPSKDTTPSQLIVGLQQEKSSLPSSAPAATAEKDEADKGHDLTDIEEGDLEQDDQEELATIADPLEPFNRAMYNFNDKLYFWFLKPVAQGYEMVVPVELRVSVKNVFANLAFPLRFVNCVLQLDPRCAAVETGRFIINSIWGIGGLFDLASLEEINLKKQERDFGQTLGTYGIGQGFYINWPIFGPSNPRDTIGLVADIFLDPLAYINPWYAAVGVGACYKVNDASLKIGDYEALKEAAIDPYVALRDAYIQHRLDKVKKSIDRNR